MSRITPNPKSARLSVSLDEQTYQELCDIARNDDVSVAWVIRRAVNDLVTYRREKGGRPDVPSRRARNARSR